MNHHRIPIIRSPIRTHSKSPQKGAINSHPVPPFYVYVLKEEAYQKRASCVDIKKITQLPEPLASSSITITLLKSSSSLSMIPLPNTFRQKFPKPTPHTEKRRRVRRPTREEKCKRRNQEMIAEIITLQLRQKPAIESCHSVNNTMNNPLKQIFHPC